MGIKVDLFSGYKMKGDDYYKIIATIARKILREFCKRAREMLGDIAVTNALTWLKIRTAIYFRSLLALSRYLGLIADLALRYRHTHNILNILSAELMTMIAAVYHPNSRFFSNRLVIFA